MENIRKLQAFLKTSQMRYNVLKALKKEFLKPSEISRKTGLALSSVSRVLFQLQKEKLVICLTPEKASWRIYEITDLGKEVLNSLK